MSKSYMNKIWISDSESKHQCLNSMYWEKEHTFLSSRHVNETQKQSKSRQQF